MRPSRVCGEGRHGCQHAKEKTRSCRASSVIINVGPSIVDDDDYDNYNARYHPRNRYNFYNIIINSVSFIIFDHRTCHLFDRDHSVAYCPYYIVPTFNTVDAFIFFKCIFLYTVYKKHIHIVFSSSACVILLNLFVVVVIHLNKIIFS